MRSERIATDLCAGESTDGNLGDHGDQLETNQRSISALEDLSALHGALWRSHRAPQIAAWWNGGLSRMKNDNAGKDVIGGVQLDCIMYMETYDL